MVVLLGFVLFHYSRGCLVALGSVASGSIECVVLPRAPSAIQKGTRVLISLWDSLMFGRVPAGGARHVLLLARPAHVAQRAGEGALLRSHARGPGVVWEVPAYVKRLEHTRPELQHAPMYILT